MSERELRQQYGSADERLENVCAQIEQSQKHNEESVIYGTEPIGYVRINTADAALLVAAYRAAKKLLERSRT